MGKAEIQGAILICFLSSLISNSLGIYPPGCSYTQNLESGQTYYVYNPGYANNYQPNTDCLWQGTSESGTTISLSCEVNLPTSTGCNGDQLIVSLSGDPYFYDKKVYCGQGTLDLQTSSNKFSLALRAPYNSVGGSFICEIKIKTVSPACNCGWKRATRIVGGTPTGVNEYTMMAGLVDITIKPREVLCGGTIISDRYVLSAAHCLRLIPYWNMGILVGDYDYTIGTDTAQARLHEVELASEHPAFDANSGINDIAIIKTKTQISFNLYVGPACLPFRYTNSNFTGQLVTYLGWGELFFNGPKTEQLYKVDVNVISNYQCQNAYPNSQISYSQLCTFNKGKDACQYDSGGPALWMDSSYNLQLIGVISAGYACGIKPGIDTRVTPFLNWIVSKSPDAFYCVK